MIILFSCLSFFVAWSSNEVWVKFLLFNVPYTPVYRSNVCLRGTLEIGEKYWQKVPIACIRRTPMVGINVLGKSQNNAVLFDANPILTRSPSGLKIFFQYNMWKCQQTIDNLEHTVVYTMQAMKIVIPVYLQVWHQLIFPGVVSIGYSICKAYVIGEHV